MADASKKAADETRRSQNLAYVTEMLGELRNIADAEQADMLCYLIEMAYIEASDILSKVRPLNSSVEDK